VSAKILIVDDNAANLTLLEFVLQRAGHVTTTATTAEEALVHLERELPNLLLLDLRLPGISGMALVRLLRDDPRTSALKIVAVTAQAMRGDEEAALAQGFDGVVTKPLDTRTLAQTIAGYLEDR
jgi:CheY-like chemotaxis protein